MSTRPRQAFIWKNQESLTKVAKLEETKLSLEERLRVRIALKVMRKAHIHGSRAQKEKQKAAPEAILERMGFSVGKKKKKKMDMTSERAMYAVDLEQFEPKNLEQIKQDAKSCFAIKRERMKLERQSAKYGKMRPIFPDLIAEIKEEFRLKAKDKHKREQADPENLPAPFRKQVAQEALSKLSGVLTSSNLISRGNRGRIAPLVEERSREKSRSQSPKHRPVSAPASSTR